MRNLLVFLANYSAFFYFLIFELFSIFIYINYNSFQKASIVNSSNVITGNFYGRINEFFSYLSLKEVNDSLASENARLRGQLKSSFYVDSLSKHKVKDTVYKQQYEYIVAKVVNNSINKINNYLTINKGKRQGVEKGMGVICNLGIVGKVINVSDNFSVVQSMLHKDSQFSAMIAKNKEIGYVEWSDKLDPHKGLFKDISNVSSLKIGDNVVTSGYSLFPQGVPIGKLSNLHVKGTSTYLLNMEVTFAVDFSTLQYVDVVLNKYSNEQSVLEAGQKRE